ncbi:MAG: ABC-2 transporter permease, partial [Candidatus Aminicenantes bacterium]|nr:ABC-2 transporter permease [Candidatus Aminicenantes bacterium]
MLKLCYKDYLASRWLWLSVAVLFILYIIQPLGQTIIMMMLGSLAVYAVLAVTLIFEDQSRTEVLYASLPLKRRTIVRGRYLLAGIIVLG